MTDITLSPQAYHLLLSRIEALEERLDGLRLRVERWGEAGRIPVTEKKALQIRAEWLMGEAEVLRRYIMAQGNEPESDEEDGPQLPFHTLGT